MCELFGICAAEPFVVNDLLQAFYGHSRVHKHGWGLAIFRGAGVSMEKEPVKADDSVYLRHRLTQTIEEANLFAHIRYATIGRIEYANCHPFLQDDESGRTWTMIHNGTLFEGGKLAPFLDVQKGTTDSERLLLYIVHCMDEAIREAGRPLRDAERLRRMDEIIVDLSYGNKMNMLLYDGEIMYVHTNSEGTLHCREGSRRVIISTAPLLTDGWKPVPMDQLQAYRQGERIFQGTYHGNDFRYEDHDWSTLYSAFSEL